MTDEDLDLVRTKLANLGRKWEPADVVEVIQQIGLVVSDALVVDTISRLRKSATGAGRLDQLLKLPGVTDVLVNGPTEVWIDRGQGLELTGVQFQSDKEVRALATRLAAGANRRLDDANPWVDARLPDGTRLHAVLSTVADPGTCISLRVPAKQSFDLAVLVNMGVMEARMAEILVSMIANKVSFLISGGTGSGKTTLLGALLGLIPGNERIVIVEDSKELAPNHPHVVHLEARPANAEGSGAIMLTDLVRQALRMRPDRLVVGEVRGGELVDLLLALNTGHEGGCGTLHANSARDVPARLEALASLAGLDANSCAAQVISAVQAVIHVERFTGGIRKVTQIGVFDRTAGQLRVQEAVRVADENLVEGPGWHTLNKVISP